VLRQQHDEVGPAAHREAPRDHEADGPRLPDQHVHQPRGLRVHGAARLRAHVQAADPRRAGRRPRAPVQGGDGSRDARAEVGSHDLSVEGHAGAHRRGGGARAPLPEITRAGDEMNVDVLHRLQQAVAERGPGAYVLTVSNDGRPHAVYLEIAWADGRLVADVGNSTARNATARPEISLLFPVRTAGDYSFFVDGRATIESRDGVNR